MASTETETKFNSKVSVRRRALFKWLNGPGAVFRQPLKGYTNYLSAYDSSGNLVRAPEISIMKMLQAPAAIAEPERVSSEHSDSEQSDLDASGRRKRSEKLLAEQEKAAKRAPSIPRENMEDFYPFPMNPHFRSQAVLSEELREEIYSRVIDRGQSVRSVSADLKVEMRRIGAVVRLKALEKQWDQQGKPLATPYSKAVMAMLPQTPYIPADPKPHETINDLPVHWATGRQMWHPVSESRHFTRRDAGKVFDRTLLPAEDRIPHPELYEFEKWKAAGLVPAEQRARLKQADEQEERRKQAIEKAKLFREEQKVKKVASERWEFRFEDISAEIGGNSERDPRGVGVRYGIPSEDRKRGQVKIPKRVEL